MGQLGFFFLGQVIQVHIIGAPAIFMGIDLILDAVQTGHQDGGIAQIGVAGGIGVPQLKPAQLGALGVGGDTDGGAPGGDDALAMSVRKLTGMKLQVFYLISDLSVLLLSLSYIPWKRMLFSLYTVVLSGQIVGWVTGEKKKKSKV